MKIKKKKMGKRLLKSRFTFNFKTVINSIAFIANGIYTNAPIIEHKKKTQNKTKAFGHYGKGVKLLRNDTMTDRWIEIEIK